MTALLLALHIILGAAMLAATDRNQVFLHWIDGCPLPGARSLGYVHMAAVLLWPVTVLLILCCRKV